MTPIPVQELREALGFQDDVESAILTLSGMDWLVSPVDRVFDGARAWLDERPVCEKCDGKGEYHVQSTRGELETDLLSCPACGGRGYTLNPERLEAAAKAEYEEVYKNPDDAWEDAAIYDSPLADRHRREAAAAILAYLGEP